MTSYQVQTIDTDTGFVYTAGQNDFGQLGFQLQVDESPVPAIVNALANTPIRQVVCGAFQTWTLTENGEVLSFGSNDEGELGRPIREEDDDVDYIPGRVALPQVCVQLAGGNSHCAALLADGKVYAWGSFKVDENQRHGVDFQKKEKKTKEPTQISQYLPTKVTKIASGAHHLVMLCDNGNVYTFGRG